MRIFQVLFDDNYKYVCFVNTRFSDFKKKVLNYNPAKNTEVYDCTKLHKPGNFYYISLSCLVADRHAVSMLSKEIEECYIDELKFKDDILWVLFPKANARCFEFDNSECEFLPGKEKTLQNVIKINRFAFFKDRIPACSLFTIADLNSEVIYCKDEFRDKVLSNNLTGLKFIEVWQG